MGELNPSFSGLDNLNALQIHDEVKVLSQVEDNDKALKDLLDKSLIVVGATYPTPQTILSIHQEGQEIPIFTRKSISATIGKAKGGKTGFTISIAAALLNNEHLDEETSVSLRSTVKDGYILFFDTEQGEYYASLTAARIKSLASTVDRLKYYDLRQFTPDVRLQLIKCALRQYDNIALVLIDGGRDIVYDINDSHESQDVITELMKLSAVHDTHINIVLHQNKGDANARGHFGSELINKSETVLSVNKDDDNKSISIVRSDFNRGKDIHEFAIERDEHGTPHIIDYTIVFKNSGTKSKIPLPDSLDSKTISDILFNCFKVDSELTYKGLQAELEVELGSRWGHCPKNVSEKWITVLKRMDKIVHNGEATTRSRYLWKDDITNS